MCVSCLGRVIGSDDINTVLIEHINGLMSRASLLVLDGPPPEPEDWVVVHSGYVIDRIGADEAVRAVAEIHRGQHLATDAALEGVHA